MTESIVVADDPENAEALHTLKRAGALLAIDDFGVGFSSIGYLQHLPVDILKIDRSFTRDVDVNERAAALVEAILVMGAALDLRGRRRGHRARGPGPCGCASSAARSARASSTAVPWPCPTRCCAGTDDIPAGLDMFPALPTGADTSPSHGTPVCQRTSG